MLHTGGAPAFLCRGPRPCAAALVRCTCRKAAGRACPAPTPKDLPLTREASDCRKRCAHPLAPSARGLRPQAVGERTVRLSEIFRAMARFSPSDPSGHLPRRGRFFDTLDLPLTREAFSFWHIFSSFLRFWNIFRLFCTNWLLLRFLLYYNDKVFENVHFTARLLRL